MALVPIRLSLVPVSGENEDGPSFQERFVARFSYLGKEYKKSLKTRDRKDAEAALHDVESRIHALRRGMRTVPPGIDPGNYIVWGDAAEESQANDRVVPGFDELVETYLEVHQHVKAESTIDGERIHLRNIRKHLGAAGTRPVDQIRHCDLENALLQRHRVVSGATVNKERRTLLTLFGWALRQDYLDASPAASLPVFEADSDGPPFRTVEEIEEILSRQRDVWRCCRQLKPLPRRTFRDDIYGCNKESRGS